MIQIWQPAIVCVSFIKRLKLHPLKLQTAALYNMMRERTDHLIFQTLHYNLLCCTKLLQFSLTNEVYALKPRA